MRAVCAKILIVVAMLAGLLVGPVMRAQAAAEVEGLRMWRAPDHTRLVFDLSHRTAHKVSPIANPDRLVIDLDNTVLSTRLTADDLEDSPVRSIRSGIRDGNDLRIVLDLHSKIRANSFLLGPSGEYGERLVVDLFDTEPRKVALKSSTAKIISRDVLANPTATAVASPPAVSVLPPSQSGRDLVIAIDAGHGGEDPGAIGPKRIREKVVVLKIAQELEKLINAQPGYRAVMIRGGDYYVGLKQRRDLARKAGADMFVSIHADAFTSSKARGSSVYALSQRGATSTSAAFLAERENGADLIGGVNLGQKDDVLASVLTDLSMTATMDASLDVGHRVLRSMGQFAHLHKSRVEQAGFAVLKSPDVPSILVETGFISNPTEASRLNTSSYQRKMANAIFLGIGSFFSDNAPPDTLVAQRGIQIGAPREYTIARGDTLSGIAERYRVSVSDLVRTNRLGGGNDIRAGQTIVIPSG